MKAVVENMMGRPSRNASAVIAQVALMGVFVRRFRAAQTRYKGTPPSRENDHSILCKSTMLQANPYRSITLGASLRAHTHKGADQ